MELNEPKPREDGSDDSFAVRKYGRPESTITISNAHQRRSQRPVDAGPSYGVSLVQKKWDWEVKGTLPCDSILWLSTDNHHESATMFLDARFCVDKASEDIGTPGTPRARKEEDDKGSLKEVR